MKKRNLTYYEEHTWTRVKGILDFMNLTQISSRWETDKNGERSLIIALSQESKPIPVSKALERMRTSFRNATAFRTANTVWCGLNLPTICVCFKTKNENSKEEFIQISRKEFDRFLMLEDENKVLKTMNRDLQARVTELENKGVENGI